MGKGYDGNSRGSGIDIGEDPGTVLLANSGRVQFTYQLIREITGMDARGMLLNPNNGQPVKDPKEQNKVMVHNLMLSIVPEAFQDPALLHRALDLYFIVLLDGDRRANHLWHYHDSRLKGWWTPGAALAAARWYDLPLSSQGYLETGELAGAIRRAIHKPSWIDSMNQQPAATLAGSIPRSEEETLHASLAELSVSLSEKDRQILQEAADCLPSWSEAIDIPDDCSPECKQVLQEIRQGSSAEGFPVVQASGRLSAVLADAWQGWMALDGYSKAGEILRLNRGAADDSDWLLWMGELCSRSSWNSPAGRKKLRPRSRRQESILRKIALDLLCSPAKPSSAPERKPELKISSTAN